MFSFVKVDKGWGDLTDLGLKKKIRNISVGTWEDSFWVQKPVFVRGSMEQEPRNDS